MDDKEVNVAILFNDHNSYFSSITSHPGISPDTNDVNNIMIEMMEYYEKNRPDYVPKITPEDALWHNCHWFALKNISPEKRKSIGLDIIALLTYLKGINKDWGYITVDILKDSIDIRTMTEEEKRMVEIHLDVVINK